MSFDLISRAWHRGRCPNRDKETRSRNAVHRRQPIVIRRAYPDDASALARLAQLDSTRLPADSYLVAEVEGELKAASASTRAPSRQTRSTRARRSCNSSACTRRCCNRRERMRPARRAQPALTAPPSAAGACAMHLLIVELVRRREAERAGTAPSEGQAPPLKRPPNWQVWAGLWTIYIVWGSTYLGHPRDGLDDAAAPQLGDAVRRGRRGARRRGCCVRRGPRRAADDHGANWRARPSSASCSCSAATASCRWARAPACRPASPRCSSRPSRCG